METEPTTYTEFVTAGFTLDARIPQCISDKRTAEIIHNGRHLQMEIPISSYDFEPKTTTIPLTIPYFGGHTVTSEALQLLTMTGTGPFEILYTGSSGGVLIADVDRAARLGKMVKSSLLSHPDLIGRDRKLINELGDITALVNKYIVPDPLSETKHPINEPIEWSTQQLSALGYPNNAIIRTKTHILWQDAERIDRIDVLDSRRNGTEWLTRSAFRAMVKHLSISYADPNQWIVVPMWVNSDVIEFQTRVYYAIRTPRSTLKQLDLGIRAILAHPENKHRVHPEVFNFLNAVSLLGLRMHDAAHISRPSMSEMHIAGFRVPAIEDWIGYIKPSPPRESLPPRPTEVPAQTISDIPTTRPSTVLHPIELPPPPAVPAKHHELPSELIPPKPPESIAATSPDSEKIVEPEPAASQLPNEKPSLDQAEKDLTPALKLATPEPFMPQHTVQPKTELENPLPQTLKTAKADAITTKPPMQQEKIKSQTEQLSEFLRGRTLIEVMDTEIAKGTLTFPMELDETIIQKAMRDIFATIVPAQLSRVLGAVSSDDLNIDSARFAQANRIECALRIRRPKKDIVGQFILTDDGYTIKTSVDKIDGLGFGQGTLLKAFIGNVVESARVALNETYVHSVIIFSFRLHNGKLVIAGRKK